MNRSIVVGGAVIGFLAAVLLLFVGFEPAFALSWAVMAALLGVALRAAGEIAPLWPPKREADPPPRSEVSRLAWAVNRQTGETGALMIRRVRGIAKHRLAARGIDLDDPTQAHRVDAALGAGTAAMLERTRTSAKELDAALRALEEMEEPR